ncbi:fructose-1,6-bisphosphatase [Tranquillimonas rosea]|uniref:Fructose-1,6-bisphosphatase n=1 Tax=Tranquillimonas rosea TaxID=641238 RepID=A0A1H9TFE1_9RHOB|nr:inositol monophosphatase [Tranquillimonas rosea]SER95816.1 fructose-1,6-bisphosphatase [Tranquillimonas rosea]
MSQDPERGGGTPLSATQEDALIALVRRVAGAEILPRFRNLGRGEIDAKTGPEDLVTVADTVAEKALSEGVARILPDAAIVGEEAVSADPGVLDRVSRDGLTVVIDPVDGTWNFANGLAVFGVLLSVLDHGEPVFGLLYDPVMDDWIRTRRGGGTWACRADAEPRRLDLTAGAGAGMGFVPLYMFPEADRSAAAAEMARGRRTTSLRCSCQEYRMVLLGGADYVLSLGLSVWDHAAGVLAVQEAGGAVRLSDGTAYRPQVRRGMLVAACDAATLDDILRRYDFGYPTVTG